MIEDKSKSFWIKPLNIGGYYDGDRCLEIIHDKWRVLLFYPPAFSFLSKHRHISFTWNVLKKLWFTFYMDKKIP